MHIYLIRHGQKERLVGDPPLTAKGKIQAEKTADFFASIPVDHIAASPLLRTRQTAEIIAHRHHLPVKIDPRLIERANWGEDPLQSWQDFLSDWYKASEDREYQPHIGDSSIAAGKRLETALSTYENPHFEHVVLVTHGGIITDWLRNFVGDEHLIEHYFGSYQNLRAATVPECSITEIVIEHGQYTLACLSRADHLE